MPTNIFLVRHAQSDFSWLEDETRPLTTEARLDLAEVEQFFSSVSIDSFFSSPYKRAVDTISPVAASQLKAIRLDPRFRERTVGTNGQSPENLKRRWENFHFSEPGGESLASVQSRNIEALTEVLIKNEKKSIVIGTHGTALSTIINFYEPNYGLEDFLEIIDLMPYIILLTFSGTQILEIEPKFLIRKEYGGSNNLKTIEIGRT